MGHASKMRRWVSSVSYRLAVEELVRVRGVAGLSQRALADRVGKTASYIAKIEIGERRLDFVEFIALCRALDNNPADLIAVIASKLGPSIDI